MSGKKEASIVLFKAKEKLWLGLSDVIAYEFNQLETYQCIWAVSNHFAKHILTSNTHLASIEKKLENYILMLLSSTQLQLLLGAELVKFSADPARYLTTQPPGHVRFSLQFSCIRQK